MRKRIVREAAKQFRAKGYQVTTLDDLASSIGVTKAAIYYYFSKKSEILLEICADALAQALTSLDALDPTEPADVRLRAALSNHVELLVQNLEAWAVFFQEIDLLREPKARAILADQRRFSNILEGILEEGMRTKVFREADPQLVALAILGMYNWVYRWYRSSGRKPQEIIKEFADLIELGLMHKP
jgi:AcrR family transcriptional regulator